MPGAMVPNAMNRCHKLTGGAIKGTGGEQGTGSDDSGTWKRLNKVEVKVEPEAMRKKKKQKNQKRKAVGMVTMVGVEDDVSRREERKGKV